MLRMAACGMDCSACASYKATVDNDMEAAEALVEWYKRQGWIGEDEGAAAILMKNPLCKGCWNASEDCFFACGCHPSRDFRLCCSDKHIAHCGECSLFPCGEYIEFVGDLKHHREAMERLVAFRQARSHELC